MFGFVRKILDVCYLVVGQVLQYWRCEVDAAVVPEDADLSASVAVVSQDLCYELNRVFMLEVLLLVLAYELSILRANRTHYLGASLVRRSLYDCHVLVASTPCASLVVLSAETALVQLVNVLASDICDEKLMLHLNEQPM